MVIIPTDLDEFLAVQATFIKSSVLLETSLAVAVTMVQKCSYFIRPVAHLDFCTVFDNDSCQINHREVQKAASRELQRFVLD